MPWQEGKRNRSPSMAGPVSTLEDAGEEGLMALIVMSLWGHGKVPSDKCLGRGGSLPSLCLVDAHQ